MPRLPSGRQSPSCFQWLLSALFSSSPSDSVLVGHHFSTVPPYFHNFASSFFLPVACTISYLLYCIFLLPHLMPVTVPLFSFSQHYSHHLPVLPLHSKQDFLASSWLFVLLKLWHIFLPYCHLCSSMVCCLILTSIFMLLLFLHIFRHLHKSPAVSDCLAWCRLLQLTEPHFCVGLSSSPLCCLLTCLRKSSWKIRFIFFCSVHFKLFFHAPIHHMWVIFS